MVCFLIYKLYVDMPFNYLINFWESFDIWYWNDLWIWFFYDMRCNVTISAENLAPVRMRLNFLERDYLQNYELFFKSSPFKFKFWGTVKSLWYTTNLTLENFFVILPRSYFNYHIFLNHYLWWKNFESSFYHTAFYYLWPLYLFLNILRHFYFYIVIYLSLIWKFTVPLLIFSKFINLYFLFSGMIFLIKYKIYYILYLNCILYWIYTYVLVTCFKIYIYVSGTCFKIYIVWVFPNLIYLFYKASLFIDLSFVYSIIYSLTSDFIVLVRGRLSLFENNLIGSYLKLDLFFYSLCVNHFDFIHSYFRFPSFDLYSFLKFQKLAASHNMTHLLMRKYNFTCNLSYNYRYNSLLGVIFGSNLLPFNKFFDILNISSIEYIFIFSYFNTSIQRLFLFFFIFTTILMYLFFNMLFDIGSGVKVLYFNSFFLWTSLRSNFIGDKFNWLKRPSSARFLAYHTKKTKGDFNDTSALLSNLKTSKKKKFVKFREFFRNEMKALEDQIFDYIMYYTRLKLRYRAERKIIRSKVYKFRKLYLSFGPKTKSIFTETITNNFIFNFESSASFDYSVLCMILFTLITIVLY